MKEINELIKQEFDTKLKTILEVDGYNCPKGLGKRASRIFMTSIRKAERDPFITALIDGLVSNQLFNQIYKL